MSKIEEIAKEVVNILPSIYAYSVSFQAIHDHLSTATYDDNEGSYTVEKFRLHMLMASAKCMMAGGITGEEVLAERLRQEELWGDTFDKKNTANDWHAYVCHYLTLANRDNEKHKINMLKAAAICQGAILIVDRYGKPAPRHYER